MDFALNEEQQMLRDSAQRFFSQRHPLTRARQALPWSDPSQQKLWADMANMGWNALLVSESRGGLQLGLLPAVLIAEESGRQLLNLPWVSSAVLLPLWQAGAAASTISALLDDAVAGALTGTRVLHCVAESDALWDHAGQCTDIVVIRGWDELDTPLELALCDATSLHSQGVGLDPTVRQAPAQIQSHRWHTIDVPRECRVRALHASRLVYAAELIGSAQAALDLACAYARERTQFGKPIGSQQAVKHSLANAWMAIDNARLANWYAAAALDARLRDAAWACAAAVWAAIDGAERVTRSAIQVHGAIGFTWEHDAHLYFKRAQRLSTRLGGPSRALANVQSLALQALAPVASCSN